MNNSIRYSRQTLIPVFSEDVQKKVSKARVALVGVGGVGSPAALYLAASGVGTITLIDNDIVELHNLQRQVLYREPEIGEKKVTLAKDELATLNSDIHVQAHDTRLSKDNAIGLLNEHDIVLDGSDNFDTRYVINDACVALNIPFISVSVDRFYGECALHHFKGSKTFRDCYPDLNESYPIRRPAERGIMGVVPGMMAMIAVAEMLKVLGQFGEVHVGKICYDALNMEMNKFKF